MRNTRPVLSRDDETWLGCCWHDCDKPGYELHKTRFHDHPKSYPCGHPDSKHVWYVFCTERHRDYFLHSHRSMGNLPPGSRLMVT